MNNRVCRLCLSHPAVCFSLLEPGVSQMLAMLTEIKVNADEELSTVTCTKCLVNLKLAFNIQQNFLRADEKLRESSLMEVKPEFIDVELAQSLLGTDKSPTCEVKTEIIDDEQEKAQLGEVLSNQFVSLGCPTCVVCGMNVDDYEMVRHVQEHFREKQTCDSCNKLFDNLEEYKMHLSQRKCKLTNQKCSECGVIFRYKSLYDIHMKQAHTVSEHRTQTEQLFLKKKVSKAQGPFTCQVCQRQFETKRQFYSHSHEKRKCPICEAEITKSNLAQHIKNHSSGPQICEMCGSTLRNRESLRRHLSQAHSKSVHNCEECGKVFKNGYRYLLHKKQHAGDKPHVCESCGKTFLTLYYLNKHVKAVHLSQRRYICKHCNKGFVTSFTLKSHMWQHTNQKPYKCDECGAGFRQKSTLNTHLKSKHKIVEPETVPCSVCGKKFSSDRAVLSHMRIH